MQMCPPLLALSLSLSHSLCQKIKEVGFSQLAPLAKGGGHLFPTTGGLGGFHPSLPKSRTHSSQGISWVCRAAPSTRALVETRNETRMWHTMRVQGQTAPLLRLDIVHPSRWFGCLMPLGLVRCLGFCHEGRRGKRWPEIKPGQAARPSDRSRAKGDGKQCHFVGQTWQDSSSMGWPVIKTRRLLSYRVINLMKSYEPRRKKACFVLLRAFQLETETAFLW